MIDAEPNAFERQIEDMIAQLGSKNATKRREAALFLGEAAAADAVPVLVEVYQRDKNAQVRAAAAYSLGMYRAVENALKEGKEDEVVQLLRKVEEDGELGKRAPVGRRVKTLLALLISLLALVLVYAARDDVKGLLFGSTRPRTEVVADVQHVYELMRDDTRTLQGVLLDVIANRPLNCIAYFNNPPVYTMDRIDARSFRDVATIADQLNAAQGSLANAKATYNQACDTDPAAFDATQAQQTFQLLLPALQALDPLELQLTQASVAESSAALPSTAVPTASPPTAIPPTAPPTIAPTSTLLQPGVELQPTIPPDVVAEANPKSHLRALFSIIDTVTDTRGAASLLVQYWTNVQNGAQTQICSVTQVPEIPSIADLNIPQVDFDASPDLLAAVQLMQAALESLRTGWTDLQFACNDQTLSTKAAAELQKATVALNQLVAARTKLEAVQAAP